MNTHKHAAIRIYTQNQIYEKKSSMNNNNNTDDMNNKSNKNNKMIKGYMRNQTLTTHKRRNHG